MDKIECFSIKVSSRVLGMIFLAFSLLLAIIGGIMLPIFGVFFALPFIILGGFLVFAPESKTCKLITSKSTG